MIEYEKVIRNINISFDYYRYQYRLYFFLFRI